MTDRLLVYYDDLRRLAESKCASREEAEDLVSETFLAAYAYIRRGGVIEYPKTYLANTLMHKRNSLLRKAYRRPPVVSLDTLEAVPEDIVDESSDEDAAELRRRILYLSETTREVLIRHYFNGYSIADIAKQIGIPAGTVKSRLSAGREKIKEGWMKPMPEKKTCIPGFLNVSYSGSDGANHEPTSLVEGDRIAQNLLITAYDRPLSVAELAAAVSIPTVYVEPIVRRLVDGELMAAAGGKVYTDFVIFKPEDFLSRFDAQLAFVHERFNRFWSVLADVLAEIGASDFGGTLSVRQKRKLERYALLRALQGFQLGFFELPSAPVRRDGGSWIAMGRAFPGGYDDSAYCSANEYAVQGATGPAADASVKCVCSSASSTRRCGTIRRDGLEAAGSTCISGKCRRFCGVFIVASPSRKRVSAARCWKASTGSSTAPACSRGRTACSAWTSRSCPGRITRRWSASLSAAATG